MRPARLAFVCACAGLIAVPSARADSVMLTGGSFGMSPARFTLHHREDVKEKAGDPLPFSFCKHCDAPESSSHMRSSGVTEGALPDFGEGFSSGASSDLGGSYTLPVPAMGAGSSSSSPIVSLPFQPVTSTASSSLANSSSSSSSIGQSSFSGIFDPVGTTNSVLGGGSALVAHANAEALSPTPEPATLLLLGLGFAGIAVSRRRRPRR